MDYRIEFVFRDTGFAPVKIPGPVWARCHTEAAPDAPVVIHDNDPVILLPCRLYGTDLYTWRLFALLTLDRYVITAFFRDLFRVIVLVRVFQCLPFFIVIMELQDLDPLDLRVSGEIVFLDAGINASPAAYAPRKVQGIAEDYIVNGGRCLCSDLFPVFECQFFFKFCEYFIQILFVEPLVMLPEQLF
jgi:hypothetical protein